MLHSSSISSARSAPGLFDRPAVNAPSAMDAMFDANQPGVYEMFADLAGQIKRAGHARTSADLILHKIRWTYTIDRGDREFKVNNNWASYLSRRLMRERPEFAGLFETRKLTSGEHP